MGEVEKNTKIIWEYMLMHQKLQKSDIIFVLGSNDIDVADTAAEIYKEGYAPLVVCSGANGKGSKFTETEAKIFSDRMIFLGVPKEKIILEQSSTNTGENVIFTKKLLLENNIHVQKVIAVQKPYMERRTYATIKKQWPEVECIVASQNVSFENYCNREDKRYGFVSTMVGDLLRIKEYPRLGFQVYQDIPDNVWLAGQELLSLGYNKYVL